MANEFEPQSKNLVDWFAERTNRDGERVRQLEISRLGKVWIGPGKLTGIYGYQGTFIDAGSPYYPFEYRLFDRDHLQVRGTMTGGTSGTLGFTLLPPFWPTFDISIWGNIEVVADVKLAVIQVNHLNGQCIINWTP